MNTKPMTRRDALILMGILPIAGGCDAATTQGKLERKARTAAMAPRRGKVFYIPDAAFKAPPVMRGRR